jgi:nucleoid-associated protein YgaU
MTKLIDVITEAGFSGEAADIMYAICVAESQANAWAYNPNANTGDKSYGLAQINMINDLGPARRAEWGLSSNDELFDPATNLKAAWSLSGSGAGNWSPWSTYNRGEHTQYLGSDHSKEIVYVSEYGSPHTDTPAPAPTPTPVVHPGEYVVKKGDTLSAIAESHGLGSDWQKLYHANIAVIGNNPDVIQPGETLVIPHPDTHVPAPVRTYTVQEGDTLSSIAENEGLGSDWQKLYQANLSIVGSNPDMIHPGQRLVIP